MRVWQPGGHLTQQRGAQVDDWSWRATARRLRTLARLTAPYKLRTTLAIASLLAATATALAPPYLAKLAIDDGIVHRHLTALTIIVAAFLAAGTRLVQNTLTLAGSAIFLFFLDWRLALAPLAVLPPMTIATAIFRSRSSRAYRAVRERLGLVTATLAEDIAGMRVVQSFTRERAN